MINKLAKEIHFANVAKGFYDEEREIGTLLMLIVSEVAEAMEADRKNRYANLSLLPNGFDKGLFLENIKDTFEDEIADVFIRILDLCGHMNIDIEKHVELKLQYNKTRGYKHDKAY